MTSTATNPGDVSEIRECLDNHRPLAMLEPSLRVAAGRALLMAARHDDAQRQVERSLQLLRRQPAMLAPEEHRRRCGEVPENAELLELAAAPPAPRNPLRLEFAQID